MRRVGRQLASPITKIHQRGPIISRLEKIMTRREMTQLADISLLLAYR